MEDVKSLQATLSITKLPDTESVEVAVDGQLGDIVCMVSASMVADERLYHIFKEAVRVTDAFNQLKNTTASC